MKKTYNYILFDFDGTLANTHGFWLDAFKKTFKQYNLFPSDRDIIDKCFGGSNEFIAESGVKDIEKFLKELYSNYEASLTAFPLYDGAKETIQALKSANKKLAIVSASWRGVIDVTFNAEEMLDLFDVIISGEMIKKHKPDPEPLFMAMKELDAKAEETIIIGDSPKDIMAGENAGVDSVLFRAEEEAHMFASLPDDLKPTHKIQHLKDLLGIIK